MRDATNPDLLALGTLKEHLASLAIEWPDGGVGRFEHIDVGFMSKPVAYPYVSLHTTGSRAPVRHLGRGAGAEARSFEISAVINMEYEDPDPERGFERLTQLRWDVFLHLVAQAKSDLGAGVEFTELDEAMIQTFNEDDGGYQDWGFFGQVLIPLKIVLRGSSL
jgi:hypothetical protein